MCEFGAMRDRRGNNIEGRMPDCCTGRDLQWVLYSAAAYIYVCITYIEHIILLPSICTSSEVLTAKAVNEIPTPFGRSFVDSSPDPLPSVSTSHITYNSLFRLLLLLLLSLSLLSSSSFYYQLSLFASCPPLISTQTHHLPLSPTTYTHTRTPKMERRSVRISSRSTTKG